MVIIQLWKYQKGLSSGERFSVLVKNDLRNHHVTEQSLSQNIRACLMLHLMTLKFSKSFQIIWKQKKLLKFQFPNDVECKIQCQSPSADAGFHLEVCVCVCACDSVFRRVECRRKCQFLYPVYKTAICTEVEFGQCVASG